MASPEDRLAQAEAGVQQVDDLFDSSELAEAVDTEDFRHFLNHVPIAIVIFKLLRSDQRVIYVNNTFEDLVGQRLDDVRGGGWSILNALKHEDDPELTLGEALREAKEGKDCAGAFQLDGPKPVLVEAYASLIENEDGTENYRIVALIDVTERARAQREEFASRLRDKEVLLLELQHRVKNNLQLVTAMIRLEARAKRDGASVNLDKLAGRIESLQLLYRDLTADGWGQAVDLGHHLNQIASSVMHTYAVDGIRFDIKVDHALASLNVAMPVGLIVNELLTNALKYAFNGRETGTITLRCIHEDEINYRIVVADDGIGFPEGVKWPVPGKLGALIVQTLRENAKKADVAVETAPEKGTRVTISFEHKAPTPKVN